MLEDSSIQVECPQAPGDMESDDICWICLDGTKDRDPLINPCRCPRKVHPRCLARWQLQQAGRLEETNCRFCQCNLADWKASLTPENLKPDVQRVQPIMVVYFEGQIHRIPVKQGPDGLKEFTLRIRELFRLPDDVDISLTFGCKEPLSGQHLKLEGIGAFDAAVHCASVAAAERQQKLKSNGGSSDAGAPVTGSGGGGVAPAPPGLHPPSPEADPSLDPSTHAASRQRLHHHYHHNQLERSASAVAGGGVASSSAPVSAQTSSGGGADGSGTPLLHPAASAPVLSHYASESNLLSAAHHGPQAGSPRLSLEASFPGCTSLSDEPVSGAHSARTSSGGGAAGLATTTTNTTTEPRQQQGQGQGVGVAGSTAFSHSDLPPRGIDPVAMSPFQAAAMGGRCARRSAGSANELMQQQLLQQQQQQLQLLQQQQQLLLLESQRTAPSGAGPALALASELPFATAISEPVTGRLLPPAPQTPPGASFSHQHQHHYHPQQQQQQQLDQQCCPAATSMDPDYAYSSFPYSMSANSQYAAPLLPPLAASGSGGGGSGPEGGGGDGQQQLPQAARPISPAPAPAAVPLTPRDHYNASSSGAASPAPRAAPACVGSEACDYQPRHAGLASEPFQPFIPTQQQWALPACVGLSAATPTAAAAANPPGSSSSGCSSPEGGPATPSRYTARRTAADTPTTPLYLPHVGSGPTASPPSSPTASSSRHHPYHAPATATAAAAAPICADDLLVSQLRTPVAAATANTPGGGGIAASDDGGCCAAATRPVRRTSLSSPRSEYDMSMPLPTDDSAALGSLTGRLKFSLRAFSRKVARSLNFQRGGAGGSIAAGAGACVSAHSVGLLSAVSEIDPAETEAQAEAEVGAGSARTDGAAVAAAVAGN